MKPRVFDLCCGRGGWAKGFLAEGYEVIGFDIMNHGYPGRLVIQDIRTLLGRQFKRGTVIVASPPCDGFSRHQMPWTRKRNPPEPDLSIVRACHRIAAECGLPMVLENVRKAQDWLGRAAWHCGPFYLWGDVPALMPRFADMTFRKKESYGSKARAQRAEIPFPLAQHIARVYKPVLENISA